MAPRKGLKKYKFENTKVVKVHPNPENDIVVSELERQLIKSTLAKIYTPPLKGKFAPQESIVLHRHKHLEFSIPENHNSKEL
jgi:hypothetical protein